MVLLIWAQLILLGAFIQLAGQLAGWVGTMCSFTHLDSNGTTGLCSILQKASLFSGRSRRHKTEIRVHRPLRSKSGTLSLHPLPLAKASHKASLVQEVGESAVPHDGNSTMLHCEGMDKERPLIEAIQLINPTHLHRLFFPF